MVRSTDPLDMTIAVDWEWDVKQKTTTTNVKTIVVSRDAEFKIFLRGSVAH